MTTQQKLLHLLADGRMHSGEEVAQTLGLSRAAIWKQVRQLSGLGIEVSAQAGKGYQLEKALDLISATEIEAALSPALRSACSAVDVRWSTASSNADLIRMGTPAAGQLQVVVAEFQTAGKGRRGRVWHAPFGDGICLSVGWRFDVSPPSLACLGLAVGVGLQRALQRIGVADIELKWPNDVLQAGKKLAGVLIEVNGEADGPLHVVIGVGVNYKLRAETVEAIAEAGGLEPAALNPQDGINMPDRNQIIAGLVEALHEVLVTFAERGFDAFRTEWQAADYLSGKHVVVNNGRISYEGKAAGITRGGELQVATSNGLEQVVSGDVQVRAVA